MAFLRTIPLRPSPRWLVAAALLLLVWALGLRLDAADAASETQLKAALIYRFATLAQWPDTAFADAEAPVVIAVVGRHGLEAAVRGIAADKKIGKRPVLVVADPDFKSAVHVLVVAAEGGRTDLKALFGRLAERPVLTIGDPSGFCAEGGMIGLRREDARLTFDVNIRALRRVESAGLKLNPQVLKLGRIVEGGDAP